MNIKITNYCSAGCSHCMEDSTKAGPHMTFETFQKAIALTIQLEAAAWVVGAIPQILISGGECTEHPEVIRFIQEVQRQNIVPVVLTNGLWLARDDALHAQILALPAPVMFQVTHQPKFYPHAVPVVPNDPRFFFRDELAPILPLGRGKRVAAKELTANRRAPTSFNLRSLTRSFNSIQTAIGMMRLRSMETGSGQCSPSISSDGTFVAGESSNCYPLGTVDSTPAQLTQAILAMGSCNRCSLETNLSQQHLAAIGLGDITQP